MFFINKYYAKELQVKNYKRCINYVIRYQRLC